VILETTLDNLCERLSSAHQAEQLNHFSGIDAIVLSDSSSNCYFDHLPQCPVIFTTEQKDVNPVVDVVVANGTELAQVIKGIEQSPIASQVLVQLLRHNEQTNVEQALFAESLAYSSLQHSDRFRNWLAEHQLRARPLLRDEPPILIDRNANELLLVLNRPEKRNAWSVELRDALSESLHLLDEDKSITSVKLSANGPAFGAGGDLDEFGLARDAGEAHLSRAIRNPGRLVYKYRDKISVHLHGACVGAGIEIPAFARRLLAKPDTFFLLPEVAFGLIPGAGGTVSILKRIGRQRLACMAIGGQRMNTERALKWGLIDEIVK